MQSIPKKTIAMFNMAINFLSTYCNATIVLSSATQPCLEKLDWPVRLANQPDMVKLDKKQMEVFERADITDRTDPIWYGYGDVGGFLPFVDGGTGIPAGNL